MHRETHTRISVPTMFFLLLISAFAVQAQNAPVEKNATSSPTKFGTDAKPVSAVVDDAKDLIVIIRQMDNEGGSRSIGCGFVIDATLGLIATNYHVIGVARPLQVETKSGDKFQVTSIHASDQQMDLAILKVARTFKRQLPFAESPLKQGDSVVAIGHPGGLEHSVVEGLLSARQTIDGRPMLQLSIPIEQGNSGGPVLDRKGNVHGILTLKSLQAENTGFAIDISVLKRLVENPNPIPFERWLTIGKLDEKLWEPVFAARWKQRVDRILVDGAGQGFGGRSLCLRREALGSLPVEISVDVRMDDESGAAGLAFFSDGKHRHYGFYPSNGRIRLTRFDGRDVYSWNVLQEIDSTAYRPGEWNSLRVVIDDADIKCFVNDALIITSTDRRYKIGRPGLARFRQTKAEYRNFKVVVPTQPGKTALAKIQKWAPPDVPVPDDSDVNDLAADAGLTSELLEEQARRLERQAAAIRQVALKVNTRRVQQQLANELNRPEADINLLTATLLLSKLDNPGIDITVYEREVERMAEQIRTRLNKDANDGERIKALNTYLFKQNGFHGNRFEYYTRSNSYMNEVIYNRQGLPITLSVLYIELAKRLDLNVVGVGLPGHFVVRLEPKPQPGSNDAGEETSDLTGQLIDPFERGVNLSREAAETMVRRAINDDDVSPFFAAQTKSQIIRRMFRNLVNMAEQSRDEVRLLRYLDTLIQLYPTEGEFRARRVVVRAQAGNIDGAIADIDWFLDTKPDGVDIDRLREFRAVLERRQ